MARGIAPWNTAFQAALTEGSLRANARLSRYWELCGCFPLRRCMWCFHTAYYRLINAVNDNGSPVRRLKYYLYLSSYHLSFIKPLKETRWYNGAKSHNCFPSLISIWKQKALCRRQDGHLEHLWSAHVGPSDIDFTSSFPTSRHFPTPVEVGGSFFIFAAHPQLLRCQSVIFNISWRLAYCPFSETTKQQSCCCFFFF